MSHGVIKSEGQNTIKEMLSLVQQEYRRLSIIYLSISKETEKSWLGGRLQGPRGEEQASCGRETSVLKPLVLLELRTM